MLRRTGKNGTDGVILLAGYTWEDPHTAVIAQEAFAGVLASGVLPARPKDSFGAQVVWLKASGSLATAQAAELRSGLPLSTGLTPAPAPPPGVQSHETILEARYDARLTEGLHLMPDLQYVLRPDASARRPDATVVALRITADF